MNDSISKLLFAWLLVVLCIPVAAANFRGASGDVSLLLAGGSGDLALTLATDEENYVKGEHIHVSGTAYGDNGTTPISCEATLIFACDEWERRAAILINNGTYTYDYTISFGDPDGTWDVTLQVGDNTVSDNISVGLPTDTVYYVVEIWSPPEGHSYMRGTKVRISANVTEAGDPVENAVVSCRSSKGDNLPAFTENSPGLYSMDHILGWDEPLGDWCISVEAKKITDDKLKAGGSYTTVEIQPAVIELDILRPTTHKFVRGETVNIEVKVSYPTGAPPENAVVTATLPNEENMLLTKDENSTYVGSYEITLENGWVMRIIAMDSYGNSGTSSFTLSVTPPEGSPPFLLILVVVAIFVAVGITSSFIALRKRRAGRLISIKEEKKDIKKAQTDAALQYFKKGEISRETYDKLMHELERKLADLEKEESILKGERKSKKKKE